MAESFIPPVALAGTRVKSTSTFPTPLLLLSITWNFTTELFDNVVAPVVLVPMIDGVADINCILLALSGRIVMFALTVAPVTDAVIVSVMPVPEPQSLSL